MTINRRTPIRQPRAGLSAPLAAGLAALMLLPGGCETAPPPRPVVTAPPVVPTARATARPAAPASTASRAPDWRDAALAGGTWRYDHAADGGSRATFGPAGAAPLAVLRCDIGHRQVTLWRAGHASGTQPASIHTSTVTRPLGASPAPDGSGMTITLPAGDRLLDAMAFSRGRFAIDMSGLAPLVLPAWAEVGRVVEDCR